MRDGNKLVLSVAILVAAVHSLFLYRMGEWLWGREHYQFFPLVIAGAAYLTWDRRESIQRVSSPKLTPRIGIDLLLSAMAFVLASIGNSPWIGLISFVMVVWTAIQYLGGAETAKALRGPIVFFCLAIPLPFNLDLSLVILLQKVATWFGSSGLDAMGIRHAVSGVAIRTEGKVFMVEEACSGIHSFFSALSAVVFFCIYSRYGLFRSLFLSLATIGWIIAANSLRVFSIVFAFERWGGDLTVGVAHTAIGICTYVLALTLAASTDQFFRFVLPLHVVADDSDQVMLETGFVEPLKQLVSRYLDRPMLTGKWASITIAVVVVCTYVPFGIKVFAAAPRQGQNAPAPAVAVDRAFEGLIDGESLATQIGVWTKDAFRVQNREATNAFGMHSEIWTFHSGDLKAEVSLDGFYPTFHDLAYCYTAIGWKLQGSENLKVASSDGAGEKFPTTQYHIYREGGGYGLILFSCFDSKFVPVDPPDPTGSVFRALKNRLVAGGIFKDDTTPFTPPVMQIQLFLPMDREPRPYEMEMAKELFRSVRQQILERLRTAQ